jgi:hypothetical protein
MIRVDMDPGTTGKVVLRLAKKSICQHFPMANFMYCCKMCYGLLFELGGWPSLINIFSFGILILDCHKYLLSICQTNGDKTDNFAFGIANLNKWNWKQLTLAKITKKRRNQSTLGAILVHSYTIISS